MRNTDIQLAGNCYKAMAGERDGTSLRIIEHSYFKFIGSTMLEELASLSAKPSLLRCSASALPLIAIAPGAQPKANCWLVSRWVRCRTEIDSSAVYSLISGAALVGSMALPAAPHSRQSIL